MLTELDHKILQTVLQEGEPISSKRLAMLCGAAINTIRKEITLLNREIESQGLFIEMKSSVGVYPVIMDPERALPYMERMRIFYNRSLHMEKQYSARVYALTRRCLCARSGLSVEKLCEEFFSSRSTILRELGEVREILGGFRLRLKNHRSSQGLTVEGSEWDIRQCLVHQHKIYMIQFNGSDSRPYAEEYAFRALFCMDDPAYEEAHTTVAGHLQEQTLFSLPTIHIPKLANLLLLCLSRQKQAAQLSFSPQQIAFVKDTPEYRSIEELYAKLSPRFQACLGEAELVSLTALLLGFGDRFEGRPEYLAEVEELISHLVRCFGYDREDFDDSVRSDLSCYLSQLESRRVFGLWPDPEPTGPIRNVGITTGNLCLAFARFYRQKYGVTLGRRDTMGCFYILHRVARRNQPRYNAQRILIFSEFGLGCARTMADKLRQQHGLDIREIKAVPYNELLRQLNAGWDLILTDMPEQKFYRFLPHCPIPVLSLEFFLFEPRSRQLEAYLDQIKQQAQLKLINADSFFRTDLGGKEEVFSFLEKQLVKDPDMEELAPLSDYLRENDTLMDMERGSGTVFLPVFTAKPSKARVVVLLNKKPLVWNHQSPQIFVCYICNNSLHDGQVMASILHKFVYMTPETRQELLWENLSSPLLTLYPDE